MVIYGYIKYIWLNTQALASYVNGVYRCVDTSIQMQQSVCVQTYAHACECVYLRESACARAQKRDTREQENWSARVGKRGSKIDRERERERERVCVCV